MSPDPYDGSYDPTNPQSFNRYAYVLNNPLSYVDPTGQCETCGANGGNWYDDSLNEDWNDIQSDIRSENLAGAQVGALFLGAVDNAYNGPDSSSDGSGSPSETIYVGCSGPDIFTFACSPLGPYWSILAGGFSPYMTDSYKLYAPSNGNQKIANQISAVNNCGSQANAAMNAGPSVTPTAQNIIDGIIAATYTVATDGAATVFSVAQKFFTGAAVRSVGHAAQDGLTFLTTYHGCLSAAGQGSPYNPYSPN